MLKCFSLGIYFSFISHSCKGTCILLSIQSIDVLLFSQNGQYAYNTILDKTDVHMLIIVYANLLQNTHMLQI